MDDSRFHDDRGSEDLVGEDCDEGSGLSDCPDGFPDGSSIATRQLGGVMIRDIVANYTQESIDEASSSAKRQALAQYYQGNEVTVLTLNGAYTDKTVEMKAINRQIKLISKIDQALTRLREGTYGFCAETAEPIGLKRLMARPVAELCIAAQEKHEKEEKVYADD